jgi:hypothetical protein
MKLNRSLSCARHGVLVALLTGVGVVCVALPVQAEQAIILPVGGDGTGKVRYEAAALETLIGLLASHGGVDVVYPNAWRLRVSPELALCERTECVPRLLSELSAEYAVLLSVWADEGREPQISVKLMFADGSEYVSTARILEHDVARAVTRVHRDLEERRRVGPGPYLRVTGTPEGAQVLVDGTPEGTVPFLMRVAPGQRYHVRVRLQGYPDHEEEIVGPLEPTGEASIAVALGQDTEPDPVADPEGGPIHLPTIVAGGALVVAGFVTALSTLVRLGDCAGTVEHGCDRNVFGPVAAILVGLGGAAVLGGTALIVLPIVLAGGSSPTGAMLELRTSF